MTMKQLSIITTIVAIASGCHGDSSAVNPPATQTPDALRTPQPFDRWLGQWNGPEGTFISLSKDADRFSIKIQSLDGAATYSGKSSGHRIEFVRNGQTEFITATDGEATGMKWLLDKSDCLTIKPGEGFCRN
jgi:hypothetical protein